MLLDRGCRPPGRERSFLIGKTFKMKPVKTGMSEGGSTTVIPEDVDRVLDGPLRVRSWSPLLSLDLNSIYFAFAISRIRIKSEIYTKHSTQRRV